MYNIVKGSFRTKSKWPQWGGGCFIQVATRTGFTVDAGHIQSSYHICAQN